MARRNATSYAERHAANIRDGVSPEIAKDEPAKSDLDSPEVQSAILRPETVEVPLDGESVTLPTQITLGQAFERKTTQIIQALVMVVLRSVSDLSGDVGQDSGWYARNFNYIPMVVYKDPVQNVVADFIALLSKRPAAEIKPLINAETISSVFMLALKISQAMNGEPQAKNAVK